MQFARPLIFTVIFTLFAAGESFSVCHVMTPTGAGNQSGSDWSNACPAFGGACSASQMVRGDTYFLSSGSYPTGGINLDTPVNGTAMISIKGANSSDHCTDVGWSSSLDTNISPAHYQSSTTWSGPSSGNGGNLWAIKTSNWLLDGNNCSSGKLVKSGQGILLDNSAVTPTTSSKTNILIIDPGKLGGLTNITVRCMEMTGAGMGSDGSAADFSDLSSTSCNSAGTLATATLNGSTRWFPAQTAADGTKMPASQITISGVPSGNFNASHVLVAGQPAKNQITYPVSCTPNATASGGSIRGAYNYYEFSVLIGVPANPKEGTYTFQNVSMHDSDNSSFQINGGSTNGVFDHIYVARNAYIAPDHSAGWTFEENSGTPSSYTIRDSVFNDIESTSQIAVLFGGNVDGMYVYGNVFSYTVNNPYNRRGTGDGIFACMNSNAACAHIYFYNNTVANINVPGTISGSFAVSLDSVTSSNWTVVNNLVWNSSGVGSIGGSSVPSGVNTVDYNTYLNSSGSVDSGTHSYFNSSATNPFVNDAAFDFHLASETIDPHLSDGQRIVDANSQTFSIDPDGAPRGSDGTWERGAFEVGAGGTPRPNPPTNVSAIVR